MSFPIDYNCLHYRLPQMRQGFNELIKKLFIQYKAAVDSRYGKITHIHLQINTDALTTLNVIFCADFGWRISLYFKHESVIAASI